MAEQQGAERAGEKGQAEGEEGIEFLHCRIVVRKEQRPDHHRHGETVDIEIVELDRRADETGEGDAGGGC